MVGLVTSGMPVLEGELHGRARGQSRCRVAGEIR